MALKTPLADYNGRLREMTAGDTIDPAVLPPKVIGLTSYRNISLTNTAVSIINTPVQLYGYHIFNPGVTLTFVHFYDVAAASVVPGTTIPILSLALPSTATGQVGLDTPSMPIGIIFANAISIACANTITGTGNPATPIIVNILYN